MAPRLQKRVRPAAEPAYTMTLGHNGQAMAHASDSRKMVFPVQYLEHLSPIKEPEVVVVHLLAYNFILGWPWFQCRNPDNELQSSLLFPLRTPGGAEVVAVDQEKHQECPRNVPGFTAREEAGCEGGGGIPEIQILGVTGSDNLLASEQVIGKFCLRVGDCTGLLGATVEGNTDGE